MSEMPQELQDLLTRAGLGNGQWGELPERLVSLGTVEDQKNALLKLQGLLEQVVENDRRTVVRLKEQVNRLRYGGGS